MSWACIAAVGQVCSFGAYAHFGQARGQSFEGFRHIQACHQVADTVMHAAAETKMGRPFFLNIKFSRFYFARIAAGDSTVVNGVASSARRTALAPPCPAK